MVLEGARGSVRSLAGMSPRSEDTSNRTVPPLRGLLGRPLHLLNTGSDMLSAVADTGDLGPTVAAPPALCSCLRGLGPRRGDSSAVQGLHWRSARCDRRSSSGAMVAQGNSSIRGTANMRHSAKEHDDDQHACCGPAPQSGGSCCGGPVESAASSPGSECCDPTSREAGSDRGQSSCCGAPAVPPADYPYGPAEYVTGTVETPVGAVPQVSRDLTSAATASAPGACAGASAATTTA